MTKAILSGALSRLASLGRAGSVGRAHHLSQAIRWMGDLSDAELAARGLARSDIVAHSVGLDR